MTKTYTKLSTEKSTDYVDKVNRLYARRYWKDNDKAENIISSNTGILVREFTFKNKNPKIVNARYMVWYLLYNRFEWSFSRIARQYGYTNAAIIYGIKKIEKDTKLIEQLETATVSFPHIRHTNSNNKFIYN